MMPRALASVSSSWTPVGRRTVKPSASLPASAAATASSSEETPAIWTRTDIGQRLWRIAGGNKRRRAVQEQVARRRDRVGRAGEREHVARLQGLVAGRHQYRPVGAGD